MNKLNWITTGILLAVLAIVLLTGNSNEVTFADVYDSCHAGASEACDTISNIFFKEELKETIITGLAVFINLINIIAMVVKVGIKHSNQGRVTAQTKVADLFLETVEGEDNSELYAIATNKPYSPNTISLSEARRYGVVPANQTRGGFKYHYLYKRVIEGGAEKLVLMKTI